MRNSGLRLLVQVFIGSFLAGLVACSTLDINPQSVESGKDFYPIAKGSYWIYKVDTISYLFSGDTTTGHYFVKEKISDTLYQQEGNWVHRIELSRRQDTSQNWVIDSIWSIRVDQDKILKNQNNRPIVKLRFPLREGSRWDGNQFNTQQDSNSVFWYKVQNLNKPFLFGNENVQSVEIIQKIDSNCINKSEFRELYLRGIGPGFRRLSFIQYVQSGDDPCGQIPVIEIGYTKTFTLLSFGKE
jgi:hypothetical protein